MDFMLQVLMSSSDSNDLSDEHDPMAIVFDDELAIVLEPFTLPDFGDDVPFIDDVIDILLPIHDQLIIGHPDGEQLVDPILIHAIPLAAIPAEDWTFVVDMDEDVGVPVFDVEHLDDDLGHGEVFDIAILDVASPVVSVIDISTDSDADSFESVTSSALQATRLEAYPADDDNAISVTPATPTHVFTPVDTPPHTSTHVSSDSSSQPPVLVDYSSWTRSIRYASNFPHTPPTHGGEPLGHPHVPPQESSPCLQTSQSFPSFPPYTTPVSDPYHPSHHSGYTRDDLLKSLKLPVEILCRRVYELENEADARPPSRPDFLPPVTPPPPSSPPPASPPPPPPPVHAPVDGHATRVLMLEQQVSFLMCRDHELEEEDY
ncbi:hypothetical protein Hanom_Chr07g00623391 [Helianthus anomalus]